MVSDSCRSTEGFVFTIYQFCKPFENTLLSKIIQSDRGPIYLRIYHSVAGGENIAAQDHNNNLRSLYWQTHEIKRLLHDVLVSVPELQPSIQKGTSIVKELIDNVIRARNLLASTSTDFLQLKVIVAKIDSDLDTISKVFDLLVAPVTAIHESNKHRRSR